jgi:hypothetical protein
VARPGGASANVSRISAGVNPGMQSGPANTGGAALRAVVGGQLPRILIPTPLPYGVLRGSGVVPAVSVTVEVQPDPFAK